MGLYAGGLKPYRVGKSRYILNAQIDWSKPYWPTPTIFDFQQQAYKLDGADIEHVRGIWIDNSSSTNDVLLSIPFVNQSYRIYAGSIVTLPIFSLMLPQITFTNFNNGTANTGLMNVILTSWELPPSVVLAGSDAPATPFVDAALITALTTPGIVVQTNTTASDINFLSTALTASTVTFLAANSYTSWCIFQNIGANPCGILWKNVGTLTTANSIAIPAGGTFDTRGLNPVPTAKVLAYSASGTTLNAFYH